MDTYDRAFNLLSKIRSELDDHSFDPTRYVASDIKRYWTSVLLDQYMEERLPRMRVLGLFLMPPYGHIDTSSSEEGSVQ